MSCSKGKKMKPVADELLEQITQAQTTAYRILLTSGMSFAGVIYAFATPNTLVINCQDYETTRAFDEKQPQLRQAIAQLQLSTHTIVIEHAGKAFVHW
jgi:hypothetical protein